MPNVAVMSQSSFWTGLFDDSDQDVQEIDEREFLGQEEKVTESDEDDEGTSCTATVQDLQTPSLSVQSTQIELKADELEGSTTEDELDVYGRPLSDEKSTEAPEADVDFLLELCRICHQGLRTDMKVATLAKLSRQALGCELRPRISCPLRTWSAVERVSCLSRCFPFLPHQALLRACIGVCDSSARRRR